MTSLFEHKRSHSSNQISLCTTLSRTFSGQIKIFSNSFNFGFRSVGLLFTSKISFSINSDQYLDASSFFFIWWWSFFLVLWKYWSQALFPVYVIVCNIVIYFPVGYSIHRTNMISHFSSICTTGAKCECVSSKCE